MTLNEIRRRPTLPGRFQPSTISVLRLNFCVRDGNRWIPLFSSASALASLALCSCFSFPSASLAFPSHPQNRTGSLSLCSVRPRLPFATRFDILQIISTVSGFVPRSRILLSLLLFPVHSSLFPYFQDQALDRLVSPSSIHYCTSTDDLSTLSSSRGLTRF